ncbi:MAG: NTP transferase domain-containing protein [Candidatus Omnitrophota bacterium]|jgi:bifunctional UDP-N-acetylglucosamine pyrophosphorylase/glucosamine-1-phosphate N-acetyltransferase
MGKNSKNNIAAIILAAGKGTRMKSGLPKALHPLCGRPMVQYVTDLTNGLKIRRCVAVLGHKSEDVGKVLPPSIKTVLQKRLLGTADAVKQAVPFLKGFEGTVLILYADNPLLTKGTLESLVRRHRENNAAATLLTAHVDKPAGYGRIIRDRYAGISGIVEEKDADDFQKGIKEINTGVVCFDMRRLRETLKKVRPNNLKKEYYLTDCIGILYAGGGVIESVQIRDMQEAMGINSRSELAAANKVMQKRINEAFMEAGITIVSPETTFLSYGTRIGQDTVIYPFTVAEKNVIIGKHCIIGPFAHLREGTILNDDVVAGNFIEIVRSKISSHTLAKHFSYIGDSRIGSSVNIGAGSVTANFDGKHKNVTVVKDKVFIGSDTVLVAPVTIGKGARTGAGSVVTGRTRVPEGATVAGVPAKLLKRR